MTETDFALTADQQSIERKTTWRSFAWGFVWGVGSTLASAVLIMAWQGRPTPLVSLALVLGGAAGWAAYRTTYSRGASRLTCGECRSSFSLRLTDRDEEVVASTPREKTTLSSKSGPNEDPKYKRESWVDVIYDVTETHTCVVCAAASEANFRETRREGYTSSTDW